MYEKTELDVSNISGLDESLLDNYSNLDAEAFQKEANDIRSDLEYVDIGDGFYYTKSKNNLFKSTRNLSKKYIDGTTQRGLLINSDGNVPMGETETVDLGNGMKRTQKKLIPYPKDSGLVKGDGQGNYFYFPELPEFIRNRIKELEYLQKKSADAAAAKLASENKSAAEKEAARKKEAEAQRAFELKKSESERKAKEEERKAKEAEAKRVAAEKQAETKIAEQKRLAGETEAKAKTKKAMIIGGSVLALVAGFFIWKKFK